MSRGTPARPLDQARGRDEVQPTDGLGNVVVPSYGAVPVFHFRTREPYGRPEHRGTFGPQNAITKLSATLMATVDYQAFPQRYALMQARGADDLFAPDPDDETAAPDSEASTLKRRRGHCGSCRRLRKSANSTRRTRTHSLSR